MTTSSPSKQWADSPCPLIPTPQYKTKKTDVFTTGATHMAHIHNAILRGYNSIYRQAPHITHEDKNDFIGYALAWFKFVKSHHDDEEAELFPKVEEIMGRNDLWTETHAEHESFLAGLAQFESYLSTLGEPFDFDAVKLLAIMDGFQEPFCHHFHHEIETIASFAELPEAKKGEEAAAVFKAWGKKTVTKAGTTDVVPFFLLNLDVTTTNIFYSIIQTTHKPTIANMKLSISSLPLLFAATSFAAPSIVAREEQFVHIGVNPRFIGQQDNIAVTVGLCRELPEAYVGQLSAIAPNQVLTCTLFPEAKCKGTPTATVTGPAPAEDLSRAPWNYDNRAVSLLCNRL
ncbi:hypothetical protein GRF29_69g1811578 [Pseudopithomyces chartarum]|uniref:Hemerythrin-like domain-containing protein n=1 Tax=Pseudopithomyces chartarum TaxID=1892770 RepID=A0AAN6M1M3_9PLEO|nr:hypothetical protein GRF29_69g1811578 [Pseudopithomyces chartarum]